MKRLLILAAVVTGFSVTGLTGAAMANPGYSLYGGRSGYRDSHWNGGYDRYGYGYGSTRGYNDYRFRAPVHDHCEPRHYSRYDRNYSGLGSYNRFNDYRYRGSGLGW